MLNFFYEHRKLVSMFLGSIVFAIVLRYFMASPAAKTKSSRSTRTSRSLSLPSVKLPTKKKAPAKKGPHNVLVYITGEIANPGVYKLSDDATIFQLVEKAGGFSSNADMYSLNFSAKVPEGGHVHIGTLSQDTAPPVMQGENRLNINSATQKELETLPGIDADIAQRIINFRNAKGDFKTAEELTKIRGISSAKLQQILPLIKAERVIRTPPRNSNSPNSPSSLVDINTADAHRIDTLPGISISLARRIVSYRKAHGHFASPEELLKVSGMTRSKLNRILPRLTFSQYATTIVRQ